jgi:hypothetical protein
MRHDNTGAWCCICRNGLLFGSPGKTKKMKISKSLLQTIALAVTVVTVTASCNEDQPKPEDGKTKEQSAPYNCPGCGMG